MNTIVHVLTLFIFILTILVLNLPQIQDNNVYVKIYLFCSILVCEFFILLFTSMFHKQVININIIIKKSIYIALISVVAYSICNDLFNYRYNSNLSNDIKATACITIFVLIGLLLDTLVSTLSPQGNDLLNNLYLTKK